MWPENWPGAREAEREREEPSAADKHAALENGLDDKLPEGGGPMQSAPSEAQTVSSQADLMPQQDVKPSRARRMKPSLPPEPDERSTRELLEMLEGLKPKRGKAIALPDRTSANLDEPSSEPDPDTANPEPASNEPAAVTASPEPASSSQRSVVADFMGQNDEDDEVVFQWQQYIGLKGPQGRPGATPAPDRNEAEADTNRIRWPNMLGTEKAGKN